MLRACASFGQIERILSCFKICTGAVFPENFMTLAQTVQEFGTPPAKKSELFLDQCQNFWEKFLGSTRDVPNDVESG